MICARADRDVQKHTQCSLLYSRSEADRYRWRGPRAELASQPWFVP
jgi:hypothetical protein